MALVMKNGVWHWRKMIDGVMFNRSTKTDDKKLAETLARKWEHEAVQAVVYDGVASSYCYGLDPLFSPLK